MERLTASASGPFASTVPKAAVAPGGPAVPGARAASVPCGATVVGVFGFEPARTAPSHGAPAAPAVLPYAPVLPAPPPTRPAPYGHAGPVFSDHAVPAFRGHGVPASRERSAAGLPADSWALPFDAASVPRARRLTRERLPRWGFGDSAEVAELLVSELVTNALRHARGPIALTLAAREGLGDGMGESGRGGRGARAGDGEAGDTGRVLRCQVTDASPDHPCPRPAADDDECGRGLRLLDTLSRWGSDPTPTGKAVWFELPASSPDTGPG